MSKITNTLNLRQGDEVWVRGKIRSILSANRVVVEVETGSEFPADVGDLKLGRVELRTGDEVARLGHDVRWKIVALTETMAWVHTTDSRVPDQDQLVDRAVLARWGSLP